MLLRRGSKQRHAHYPESVDHRLRASVCVCVSSWLRADAVELRTHAHTLVSVFADDEETVRSRLPTDQRQRTDTNLQLKISDCISSNLRVIDKNINSIIVCQL